MRGFSCSPSASNYRQTPSPPGEGWGEGEAVLWKIPFESIYTAVEYIPLNLAFSLGRRNFTSHINVFWDSF
jgi:hypothetical protein